MADDNPTTIALPIALDGFTEQRIELANWMQAQFVAQDEFVLTIGQAHPPAIFGESPEERRKIAEQMGYVTVKVLGKYSMTLRRVEELIVALQAIIQNYHDATEEG